MKKLTAVILAMIMVVGLAACGSSSSSTTTSTETATTAAPANRLEQIKANGVLQVTMEPYFAPYEFIDPSKSGADQYQGSDVEFAKYIADKLGVKLEIIPLEFGAVLTSISEAKYDMAISALSWTEDRNESMNLSKGYYYSGSEEGYGFLIREEDKDTIKSPEDFKGKVLIAQSGSLQEGFIHSQIDDVYDYADLKLFSSTNDGGLALMEKKGDALCVAFSWATVYIEQNPDAGLCLLEGFQFTQEGETGTVIGMPKGEDELTEAVNAIIDEMRAEGLFDKWHEEATAYATKLGL